MARRAPGPAPRSRRGRPAQRGVAPCDETWAAAVVAAAAVAADGGGWP